MVRLVALKLKGEYLLNGINFNLIEEVWESIKFVLECI